MSEPPVAKCPVCGAEAERQLSAGAGLLFKGSGFYITDYRSDNYKKAAAADNGGGSKSDPAPGAAKSESKGGAGKSESAGGAAKPAAGGE